MEFRTPCPIPQLPFKINHQNRLALMGSCFTTSIGRRLSDAKFQTMVNPAGIMYNPQSIELILHHIGERMMPEEKYFLFDRGEWHSFLHHGVFSSPDRDAFHRGIASSIHESRDFFEHTDYIFITLGTAFIYTREQWGYTVANCHKCDASLFERRIMEHEEVVSSLKESIAILKELNNSAAIILTVSPVIHTRDGLTANTRSKGRLCSAVHDICESEENCFYFPSYDIVTSELRDYRFYGDDMCHPSEVAVNYIWERFRETFFSEETQRIIDETEKIQNNLRHKPGNRDSAQYRLHLEKTLNRIIQAEERYGISFDREREIIQEGLSS